MSRLFGPIRGATLESGLLFSVWVLLLLLLGEHLPRTAEAGWDYSKNGANWDNEGVCKRAEVTEQSPIDLPESSEVDAKQSLYFKYPLVGGPVRLLNDGHSLAITLPETYKGGFSLAESPEQMLDSEAIYRLWQIHFHSPSEHTIQGKHSGLEMQLVHKDIHSHKVAIYSVLFQETGESSMFLGILQEFGLPTRPWEEVTINRAASPPMPTDLGSKMVKDIDLRRIVNGSSVYRYTGGMTEPPCEPNVEYFVRQHPTGATQDQMTNIQNLLRSLNPPNGNNREIQPLGDRKITMVPAMDFYDPAFVPVKLGDVGAPPKKELPDAIVVGNPEFGEINQDDSPELKKAKTRVQVEQQNAESARVAAGLARQDLTAVEDLYSNAPGLVEKIELKWTVIDKTNAYNGAVVASEDALKDYNQAVQDAKKVIEAEIAKTGVNPVLPPTTTPAPAATTVTTTTVTTTVEGQTTTPPPATAFPPEPTMFPGWKLGYSHRVVLPRGDAGNPFLPVVAENVPRIGNSPGLVPFGPDKMHLKENLRQRQGPLVPVPQLVRITTTPTTTTTAPVAIENEVYVDAGNITNKTEFEEKMKEAIAKATGVDPSQVNITNITDEIITPPPGPANATNLTNATNATNASNATPVIATAPTSLLGWVNHPERGNVEQRLDFRLQRRAPTKVGGVARVVSRAGAHQQSKKSRGGFLSPLVDALRHGF